MCVAEHQVCFALYIEHITKYTGFSNTINYLEILVQLNVIEVHYPRFIQNPSIDIIYIQRYSNYTHYEFDSHFKTNTNLKTPVDILISYIYY